MSNSKFTKDGLQPRKEYGHKPSPNREQKGIQPQAPSGSSTPPTGGSSIPRPGQK